jgi:hypothetical protein
MGGENAWRPILFRPGISATRGYQLRWLLHNVYKAPTNGIPALAWHA